MKRSRWAVPVVAAGATVLAAVGFGAAVNLALSRSAPTPQLRTVSATTLAGYGLRLGPASAPPYCGLQQAVAQRGWLPPGSVGCPISQSTAEAAAARPLRGQALESVLASVSSSQSRSLRGGVAWVVVVRQRLPLFPTPIGAGSAPCAPRSLGGGIVVCPTPLLPSATSLVVVVDAHSGQPLAMFAVMGGGRGVWMPPPAVPVGGAG
jgi:hypothetical protein